MAKKGKRALFALTQTVNKFKYAKPKLLIKLFDTLIQPILLYSSEVWGLMNMSPQATSLDHGSWEKFI